MRLAAVRRSCERHGASILLIVMRVIVLAALSAVAFSSSPASAPPPQPDVDVGAAVPVVDIVVTSNSRRASLPIKELLAERVDLATLPPRTPITIWKQDGAIVGFRVDVDGAPFTVLRAHVGDFAFVAGAGNDAVFVDDNGGTLVGDTLASPIDAWMVSSRVGERIHPISHRKKFHAGTDYAAPVGTPVMAVKDGVVTKSTRSWGAGRFIVVRHGDKSESKYFHLDERWVEEGARVKKGDVIGVVGKTGRVTGPHLHFELRDARGVPLDMAAERWPGRLRVDDDEAKLLAFRIRLLNADPRVRWIADVEAVPAPRHSDVDLGELAVSTVSRLRARGTRRRRSSLSRR